MFRNYFLLNRFVVEANNELNGLAVTDIFTQEKDKVIISFTGNTEGKFLEISVNPGLPFINLRKSFYRAKRNTTEFCSNLLPSQFISITIADNDRIICINSVNVKIYFFIRGKYTNVAFERDNELELFKKNEDQDQTSLMEELHGLKFIAGYKFLFIKENVLWEEIRKEYPTLGKEIIAEAQARTTARKDYADAKIITGVLNDIRYEQPALFIDEQNNIIRIAVKTFHVFQSTAIKVYNDLITALNVYFSTFFRLENVGERQAIISKKLEKELERSAGKLNKLKYRIDSGSREEEYNKFANLLLINKNSLHKGMSEIQLPDIYNEEIPLKIKINETLSPQGNIDYYFEKSKSERINYRKSLELYNNVKKEYDRLKNIQERFRAASGDEELDLIMKELKINTEENKPAKEDISSKFKQYIINDKYRVYVGRDSQNNDLLTMKFAKQNDFWFHARSVPGSHVVLRVNNSKEVVPKDVLKKAAALAAYHSKAKTSGMAPVSYTFKKYVVKKKGMEPGKVALLKEDVLIVKPEVPSGCVFVGSE